MQIAKSSKEYLREFPIVKKLVDILEDNDIFIFAVSDENEEEYTIYEQTQISNSNKSITTPKFYLNQNQETSRETFIRPDHYIVYSGRNANFNENEINIDESLIKSLSGIIEACEIKIMLTFLEDNYNSDAEENFSKYTLSVNFPHVREDIIHLIYDVIKLLIKYWIQKTSENKKSLLRKYWRKHNLSDKFIMGTFNKRINNKIKTRSSNKYIPNLIKKLKEKKFEMEECLAHLLQGVVLRERLKKAYIEMEIFDFYGEKTIYYHNSIKSSLSFFQKFQRFIKKKKIIKLRKNKKNFLLH